jgi:ribosome-associated protein
MIYNVEKLCSWASVLMVVSGDNTQQIKGIVDEIREELAKAGAKIRHSEGQQTGHWVLLDYGDLVIHVFLEEKREFYGLERLWGDAEEIIYHEE